MTALEQLPADLVEADVAAIVHLDFDPQCQSLTEVVLVVAQMVRIPMGKRRCSNASAFVVTCLGCKHRSFQCDEHHTAMFELTAECGQCGSNGPGHEVFAFFPLSGGA